MLAARRPGLGIRVLLCVLVAAALGAVAAEPANTPTAARVRELLQRSVEGDDVVGAKEAKQALDTLAVPEAALVEFLLGPDEPLHEFAWRRLKSLASLSPGTMARLVAVIEAGTRPNVPFVTQAHFYEALHLLCRFPHDVQAAIPALRVLAAQPEHPAWPVAVLALICIDPAGPQKWLPVVERDLARFTAPAAMLLDRGGLAACLRRAGLPAEAILAAHLNGKDARNRVTALEECARLGSRESLYIVTEAQFDADPALRKLAVSLLDYGCPDVDRTTAANDLTGTYAALDGLRNGTADALPLLVSPQAVNAVVQEAAEIVAFGSPDTRRYALHVFRGYDMLAAAAEPMLREAYLRNPDNIEAAAALLEIGWVDDIAFKPYRPLLQSTDLRLRAFAATLAAAPIVARRQPAKTPGAQDPYARQMEALLLRTWADRAYQPLHADDSSRSWMDQGLVHDSIDLTDWAFQGEYVYRGEPPPLIYGQRGRVTVQTARANLVPAIKSRFADAHAAVAKDLIPKSRFSEARVKVAQGALRYIDGYEYRFRAEFAALLPELSAALANPQDADAWFALEYLSLLGEYARPAIPDAVACYRRDPDHYGDALAVVASQLDAAGREDLWAEMSKAATDGNDAKVAATRDRWRAWFAVRTDEERDRLVAGLSVPQLLESITHEDYGVRLRVLRRLAALEGDARKQAVQALAGQLDKIADYGP